MITEGEKACDAAGVLLPELVAVTWAGGAKAVHKADWSALAGRSCVIWPDADRAGAAAEAELVAALRKAGASKIKIIARDERAPQGWDAADALASGWTPEKTWAWAKARIGPDLAAPEPPSEPPPEPPKPPETPETPPPPKQPETPQAAPTPVPATPQPPASNVTPLRKPRKPDIPRQGGGPSGNAVPAPVPDPDPEQPEGMPPQFSEDALARGFVDRVGENWRYTSERKQWYRWNGAIWKPEKTLLVFDEARTYCCQVAVESDVTAAMRRDLASRSAAMAVVAMAGWDRRVAVEPDAWDTDKWLLGTPGGVVDLRIGKVIEASREHMITMSSSVAPEEGEPTTWLRCLSDWTGGDQSLIDYLQRLCGYLLTGETREQMLAFVHGPAKAGKSTIIKHIADIMGEYAANVEMETLTESKQASHSSELARLRGRRFVYAAETEEGRRWAEARIKKLSGEDKVTARELYQNPEEFTPEFKLVIYGNHAPHLRNPDDSIARRLHIIPFTRPVSPENRDYMLDEKLRREHGRILSWMLQGCMAWADCGLGLPEIVSDAVTKYMDAEDTFGDWITECVDREASARERSADMYRSYRTFIESRGEAPVSQKRFAPKLEERGFRRLKSGGIRMFEGGKLRPTGEQSETAYRYRDD
jgi:putative DNA primase/helicase